jgi:hypothetical protein
MSDIETQGEQAEKARVRRRWLTLGEILAVAAVVISALTFWNSYRERTDAEATRAAESARAGRAAATLVLQGKVQDDGDTLAVTPRLESQVIQEQRLVFPAGLKLDPVETSGNPRIERGWIEEALTEAREKAGARKVTAGDARLPVLIVTTYLLDNEPHVDRAVYEIGYGTRHSLLGGTSVILKGLSRSGAVASEAAGRKRIDARWTALIR